MGQKRILCPVLTGAIPYAASYLADLGFEIVSVPDHDIKHLLLPVPFTPDHSLSVSSLSKQISPDILISGGNLDGFFDGFQTVDYLKDPDYLAANAAITAGCAMAIAESRIGRSLAGYRVLIIGWGRIGKCLHRLFDQAGSHVTAAARKATDRAMIRALGSRGISIEDAALESHRYDVILNTVPFLVLPDLQVKENAVILELASSPGMSGAHISDARGLPGKMAPEASGKLIAETFIRLSLQKEESK